MLNVERVTCISLCILSIPTFPRRWLKTCLFLLVHLYYSHTCVLLDPRAFTYASAIDIIIRSHTSQYYVDVVTDGVVWSVSRSVTIMSPAKIAESIEMLFRLWTLEGPRKHALCGVHTSATWRIPLNRPCLAAMRPFCQNALATCYYYYLLVFCHLCCIWWLCVCEFDGLFCVTV